MNDLNILITSAGRRVELVNCFQQSKKALHIDGNIVAADASDTAPACFFADKKYKVCRIDDENYVQQLMDICKKEKVCAIIPTIDTELLKLAEHRETIEKETGAKVILSSEEFIRVCRDKYKTADFLKEHGFNTPKYITQEELQSEAYNFPLFIKPLNGSSSINAFKVNNTRELEFFTEYINDYILQEFIEGVEYTIDVFCDFEGQPITIVPRKRLAVRSGEVLKGITEKNQLIIDQVKKLIAIIKPMGQITVQGILANQELYFIEINPRFGGGAPISIAAGADSSANLFKLLQGEKLTYQENYKDDFLAVRFDQAVFIDKDGNVLHG